MFGLEMLKICREFQVTMFFVITVIILITKAVFEAKFTKNKLNIGLVTGDYSDYSLITLWLQEMRLAYLYMITD